MKTSRFVLLVSLIAAVSCSSLKTRKEAAEEAKAKAEAAKEEAGPIDDPVLNDELSAMGIDPENPKGKPTGTPEPEDAKDKKKKKK